MQENTLTSLKAQVLSDPNSCLNKADAEEFVFVLRATDAYAPMTIRHWCTMSVHTQSPDKIRQALAVADAMERWRNERGEGEEKERSVVVANEFREYPCLG